MIAAPPVEQHCGECGRGMLKAHRIYHGRRFCLACYSRVFGRRDCPRCSLPARLPKSDLSAVCTKCELDVPCIRCGKVEYKIGKVTAYGPACTSCAVYFRISRASAVPEHPNNLAASMADAPSAQSPLRATCGSCRRHRAIAILLDGIPHCKLCVDTGPVPCPMCNKAMPAGRGTRCEDCYWRETFFKRVALDEAGLATKRIAFLFKEFGTWLIGTVPSQKAALSIHRYFPFFSQLDAVWGEIPTYEKLLKHFSAEGLRRVRLPMRWLIETARVTVDANLREETSERRRIEAIGSSLREGTMPAKLMTAFKADLYNRNALGEIKIRTVRMALRPAAALLTICEAEGRSMPSQVTLNRYLAKVPGQSAAVTGFISFINSRFGAGISLELSTTQAASTSRKRLEKRLIALTTAAKEDLQFRRQWFSVALSYFHGLPLSVGRQVKDANVTVLPDRNFSIIVHGKDYWIPRWDFHASGTQGATAALR